MTVKENKIKPGYKKTPIGIIPKDWEVRELGEISSYFKGNAFKSNEYSNTGTRIIRVSDLGQENIIDGNMIYIDNFNDKYKNYTLYSGDLIITTVGSKPPLMASIVGRVIMVDKANDNTLLNQNAVCIKSKQEEVNNVFLYNNLKLNRYFNFIGRVFRGNANQANITINDLLKFKLPIPPLPEQKAIADCLSTWDKGIEKLTALIQSKKEQKKGLMQQLLTGEKRLDGFTEEWEYKKISEVAQVIGGGTPSTTNDEYWNGEINWFTPTEIKNKFVSESLRTITEKGLKNSSAKLLPPGTILLTTRATIGEASIAKNECSTNQGFQSIVCIDGKANVFFFYDLIRYNKKEFLRRANGSTFLEISKKEIDKIEFYIPSYKEQTAIAEVLSAADKEIELFEKKLDQFKTQKKGLMQVLLTGQRRLLN